MCDTTHIKAANKTIYTFGLIAVSLLILFLTVSACSRATKYEPSPEEIMALILEFPPVPAPPVTPGNESTIELETAIGMGQGWVDMEMYGFKQFISDVQNTEAHSLKGKRGYRWISDPGNIMPVELRAWIDKEVQFEMDYTLSGGFPSHFYPTRGWFTSTLSDGEMQHQTVKMEWSTDEEGLSLELDSTIGSFAAFDSTHGGGWVRWSSKGGLMNGHRANWDAEGNITISYWISSGL